MSNYDSDGPSDQDWEDRGELAWNEFDWEQYLREQDEVIHRYIAFYEKLAGRTDRLDEVAQRMGWDDESWSSETDFDTAEVAANEASGNLSDYDAEPYTLHKNPIFIATKGIYLSLKRGWEQLADQAAQVPQGLALSFHTSLHRGEEQATLGIQALDFGDYAMAISLFKRALRELNHSLALIGSETHPSRALASFREDSFPRLFDLREIWLRVMSECREELVHPSDDDEDDED